MPEVAGRTDGKHTFSTVHLQQGSGGRQGQAVVGGILQMNFFLSCWSAKDLTDLCRVAVLQQLLGKGYNVLAVDVDLIWLREPFGVLEAAGGNFLVSADSSDDKEQFAERPCAGVIFARATESTRCACMPSHQAGRFTHQLLHFQPPTNAEDSPYKHASPPPALTSGCTD